MTDSNAEVSGWHLDKRVPIAFIVTLLGQFVFVIALITRMDAKSDEHERRLVQIEAQRVSERLSSIEVQLVDAKALLVRINDRNERREDRERGGVQR